MRGSGVDGSAFKKRAHGFRIERRAGLPLDFFDGVFARSLARSPGRGDREQTRQPGNFFAAQFIRKSRAVEPLVMRADDLGGFFHAGAEGAQFLPEHRMLLDERALRRADRSRIVLPRANDLSRNADHADVVQQRGAFKCAALFGGKIRGVGNRAAELRGAARLGTERGIKRLHGVQRQFDRTEQILFELAVHVGQLLVLLRDQFDLMFERLIQPGQLFVDGLRWSTGAARFAG